MSRSASRPVVRKFQDKLPEVYSSLHPKPNRRFRVQALGFRVRVATCAILVPTPCQRGLLLAAASLAAPADQAAAPSLLYYKPNSRDKKYKNSNIAPAGSQ